MLSDLSLHGRPFRLCFHRIAIALAIACAGFIVSVSAQPAAEAEPEQNLDAQAEMTEDVTQGALRIAGPGGGIVECPLTHTDVRAEISGFLARVRVTQTFKNPKDEKIEAVYVFPLPHQSAIDEMTMVIGDRRIEGKIKRRDEARRIYEQALYAGQTTALLEQERPNIFTQSVGNIPPGATIRVEISYVDVLKYDQGEYEFSFPMVVGPRFNPGTPSPAPGLNVELAGHAVPGGAATTRVPDGDRINPPILRPGHRTGHDVSLTVHLDAGVPVQDMKVTSHESSIERPDNRRAIVKLNELDSIPNKDFVLRYDVTGEKPAMALLAHKRAVEDGATSARPDRDAGYFMLMVQPGDDERLTKSPPREIVFLIDVSGSMRGEPTQKVVGTMQHMLKLCREGVDTVQVVTFASQANKLFDAPVPVNRANIDKALQFTSGIRAGGGTQMLEGVKLAMDQPIDPERLRIVMMLTDGYIGNEAEIIEHVGQRAGDQIRFWCVGIGASPNMFLIDGVARQGGGMGKQLNLNDDAQTLATEVITRIQRAQLSDVQIDWGGLNVFDTFPAKLPELWAGRPVILFGRYTNAAGPFAINVKGRVEGEPATWPLTVDLPANEPQHDVLAPTWARQKIEDLMQSAFYADSPPVVETVTALALDYRLMSQYTSFVAVDDSQPAAEGPVAPPHRMLVPVPLPAGTRWEGFFGPESRAIDGMDLAEGRMLNRGEFQIQMSTGGEQAARELSLSSISAGVPVITNGPVPASASPAARPANEPLRRSNLALGFGGGGFDGGGSGGLGVDAFGGRLAGQRGGGGRGGRGRGLPAQSGRQLSSRLASPQLQRASAADSFQVLLRDRIADENRAPVQFGYAVADKFAAAQELAWFNPPAANADPAAHVFVWEQTDAGPTQFDTLAQAAFDSAEKAIDIKDVEVAMRELQRAIFFAEAQANRRAVNDVVSTEAATQLQKLRVEQIAEWKKASPWLNAKLDLVLRDVPADGAIAQVFAAVQQLAGGDVATFDVVTDSLSDAAALGGETQIHFLDLRGATVADALNWILLPARLTWQLDGQKVAIASARRLPGVSCWVYDVADMAVPRHSELGDPANQTEYLANAEKATNAFIAAVRTRLEATAEGVQWFAPGQLLVVGDPTTHSKAAALFAELANGEPPIASDLQKLTVERIADRRDARTKADAASAQYRALVALEAFGWPLLRNAAEERVDLEALTELQIAWKMLDRATLPAGARGLLLRTAWIAKESARALPGEKELTEFAATLAADTREISQQAVTTIAASGDHSIDEYLAVTYAALARRDDTELSGRAYEAISAATAAPTAWLTRTVVPALFGQGGEGVTGELATLVRTGQISGDDAVVLTALGCRRAGGDAWAAFRAESSTLLGRQPLAGDVVVFVNGMSATGLPIVIAAQ